MDLTQKFSVIVVGGGHAGTEAALASARAGVETLLLTHNIETLGQMSCNPSIGGIGKSHLVKEIDALGGAMARAADSAGIHFRVLNASKGPAVRATRAQADRVLYRQAIRQTIENQPHLKVFQQGVEDLIVENDRVVGVVTQIGLTFYADNVILTVGTFLGGKIHIGEKNHQGGRAGDPPANALSVRLRQLPLRVGRLKTGTPPRIDGNSIDYAKLEIQSGDLPTPVFSFLGRSIDHPRQVNCHIAHTTQETHEIIRSALHRSPMYSGLIQGRGPRYCPSIEDKVVRFADRTSHQVFLEPEGLTTSEIYPAGVSTSLPFDVQVAFIRSIPGMEHAHITRPGYAIEYDYFDPRDLKPSLETRVIEGLFFAGQINGTTGYEEAAAQGIVAGINAARRAQGKSAWHPSREQCYLGVLVDDLITQGAPEPYRMFTSRAEYRLQLREDNADLRLTPLAHEFGIIDSARWQQFCNKKSAIETLQRQLQQIWVRPDTDEARALSALMPTPLLREARMSELLVRPEIQFSDLQKLSSVLAETDSDIISQVEIQAKYSGYIERQQQEILRHKDQDDTTIPSNFDYHAVSGLSTEIRERLLQTKPGTIGSARRIPGMTPAAVSLLLVFLKKRKALCENG